MTQETWEDGEGLLRLVIMEDVGFLVSVGEIVSWVKVGDEGVDLFTIGVESTFSMVTIEVVLFIVLLST